MKLIFAVVNKDDIHSVYRSLNKNGFYAKNLGSKCGFFISGNTTFMICTQDSKVDIVIELIAAKSHKRKQVVDSALMSLSGDSFGSIPTEIQIGGATIFVTDVERFEKV